MVRTSGIAWNRLALLINFYSDTALLIPIHGLCVAGKNTFLPVFASGFSANIEVHLALQIICKFLSEFDILCRLTRSTLIKIYKWFSSLKYLHLVFTTEPVWPTGNFRLTEEEQHSLFQIKNIWLWHFKRMLVNLFFRNLDGF